MWKRATLEEGRSQPSFPEKRTILFFSDCVTTSGSEKTFLDIIYAERTKNNFQRYFAFRRHKNYDPEAFHSEDSELQKIPLKLWSKDDFEFHGAQNLDKLGNWLVKLTRIFLAPPLFSDATNMTRFAYLMSRVKPDLVHINNGGFPGAVTALQMAVVARMFRVPVVLSVNNIARKDLGPYSYLWTWLTRIQTLKVVGNCCAVSESLSLLYWRANCPQTILSGGSSELERVAELMPLNANPKVPDPPFRIVVAAVLEERKGIHDLLRALFMLRQREGNFVCEIFGAGPLEAALSRAIKEMRLGSHVVLRGYSGNWLQELRHADLLVLSSRRDEGVPLVIIEALALGIPVVATEVGGIPEAVIPGRTGLLVGPNDPEGLCEGIQNILRSPQRPPSFGKLAKQLYRQRFSYENYIAQWCDLYQSELAAPLASQSEQK